MSKIKIVGHASGSGVLTIAAPNTDTDRTITIPDVTGTLLDSGSDLPAANLTGTIADARFPATLPAISGANLTGVGVDGISSSANATAITIDSSEQVGIGVTSPQELLHIKDGSIAVGNGTASNNTQVGRIGFSTDSSNSRFIGMECYRGGDAANGDLRFHTYGGDSDAGERLRITNDGRGLSQFTAKAWCNFDGTGTPAFRDSHNCSSLDDNGTGDYDVNFTVAMSDTNYSVTCENNHEDDRLYCETMNTTHINVKCRESGGTYADRSICCAMVFGD